MKRTAPRQAASVRSLERWAVQVEGVVTALDSVDDALKDEDLDAFAPLKRAREMLVQLRMSIKKATRR